MVMMMMIPWQQPPAPYKGLEKQLHICHARSPPAAGPEDDDDYDEEEDDADEHEGDDDDEVWLGREINHGLLC